MNVSFKCTLIIFLTIGTFDGFGKNVESGQVFLSIGIEWHDKLQHDSAIYYFRKANRSFKKQLEWEEYFEGLCRISRSFSISQQLDSATDNLKKARQVLQKNLNSKDSLKANYNFEYAFMLTQRGSFNEAIEYLIECIEIRTRTLSDTLLLSDTYTNLGVSYGQIGDYDNEIKSYEKALQLKSKILEDEFDTDLATIYSNLGTTHQQIGDHARALDYYFKTLHIDLKVLGESHPFVAQDYNLISSAYAHSGRYDESIRYQKMSQEIYIQQYGDIHYKLVYGYSNMALALSGKGNYSQAINYLKKGVEVVKKLYPKGNFRTVEVLQNLGEAYSKIHAYDSAILVLKESSNMMEAIEPGNYRVAKAMDLVALIHLKRGDYNKALKYCQVALSLYSKGYLTEKIYEHPDADNVSVELLFLKALNHKSQALSLRFDQLSEIKDLEFAFETSLFAISQLEAYRREFRLERSKIDLNSQTISIYEQALSCAYQLFIQTGEEKYKNKAFALSEKSKAFILRLSVEKDRATQFSGIPDALLSKERSLQNKIAFERGRITQFEATNAKDKVLESKSNLFSYLKNLEHLISKMEKDFPRYYQLKYAQNEPDINKLQDKLSPDQLFIEYFVGDSNIYILSATIDKFNIHLYPKDESYTNSVQSFTRSLTDYDLLQIEPKASDSIYISSASSLYEKLIEPILKQHQSSITKLILVPDNELEAISFEALLTAKGDYRSIDYTSLPYLLNDFQISYERAGASLFRNESITSSSTLAFAGFASGFEKNPIPDSLDSSISHSIRLGNWKLPGAKEEVRVVSQLMNGSTFIDSAATESTFKKKSSKYRVLHLAMHGVMRTDNQNAELIFSGEKGTDEDGFLTVPEIYNLDLNADLVVLGACHSGSGEVKRGEGTMSLSRAFQYAGAQSVMMSLWKIPDEPTKNLMIGFYKGLQDKMSKDEALRNSKLAYLSALEDPLYGHPYYWAGFILTGNPEPLESPAFPFTILYFCIAVAAIFILVFRTRLIRLLII
ncbi:MAG: CHAT domain-containing tetratricopeptide repeat protein [Cyclobacteriaceae bacterium]